MLQSMWLQRVRHDWATEQQQQIPPIPLMWYKVEPHSTCHNLVIPRKATSSMIWNLAEFSGPSFVLHHQTGIQMLRPNETYTTSCHTVLKSNFFLVPLVFVPWLVLWCLWEHKFAFLGLLRDGTACAPSTHVPLANAVCMPLPKLKWSVCPGDSNEGNHQLTFSWTNWCAHLVAESLSINLCPSYKTTVA